MADHLDTLRNDLVRVIIEGEDGLGTPDAFVAYLRSTSGEQRRALLGILGYEVREGTLDEIDVAADGSGDHLGYYTVIFPAGDPMPAPSVLTLVLRDQRETTGG